MNRELSPYHIRLETRMARMWATVMLILATAFASTAYAQNIYTVAGGPGSGYGGDGGEAIKAMLQKPQAVAIGKDGAIFIADTYNRAIRKIDKDGTISTFVQTTFGLPFDLAFDATGNLYVGSSGGVHRIAPNGLITQLAGGKSGFSGDGGPAISAGMGSINGIAIDRLGNVYLADTDNSRIRKISTDGVITTVAGNGIDTFYGDGGSALGASIRRPYDVDVDTQGNIYIADTVNSRIRVVDSSGIIRTAVITDTNGAWFVVVDKSGAIYNGGYDNHRVSRTDTAGIRTEIAGTGVPGFSGDGYSATSAQLYRPMGIALDSAGNLFIADSFNNRIRKVVLGNLTTLTSDFNGDSSSDIFWRNSTTGENMIWGKGEYTRPQAISSVSNIDWRVGAQGDFDGDHVFDVLWRNMRTGANAIWKSARSTSVISTPNIGVSWRLFGTGDFNGDGRSDLVWRNTATGAGSIWLSAKSSATLSLGTISLAWQIVGIGDFDADGKSDIVWRNQQSGSNLIWRSGLRSQQWPLTSVTNLNWNIVGVGDFDGNGQSDVLWRNGSNGSNVIWRSANAFKTQAVTGVGNLNWQVEEVADYDGDHVSDILWHNTSGQSVIWKSGKSTLQKSVRGLADPNWQIAP